MAAPTPRPAARGGAVPLALGGIALLCAMDAALKEVMLGLPVALAVCLSFAARVPFAVAYWRARGGKPFGRAMLRFHAARGLVIAFSTTAFFEGVDRLPLAEAITISFVSPLLIPFIAWALLGERPRRASLFAGALGFAGVAVAAAGDGGGVPGGARLAGVLWTVAGAVSFALGLTMLRARAGADGPARVNLLGSIFPAVALAPFALAGGGAPAAGDAPLIVLAGMLGAVGMALYAAAYGRAQAQALAPIEYTALAWAALLGWAFFGEVPGWSLVAGATLIVAAAWLAHRDERRSEAVGVPGG